jgi:hypothetical protein
MKSCSQLPEARQVFDEQEGQRTALIELDAVLHVQKPGHQVTARNVAAVASCGGQGTGMSGTFGGDVCCGCFVLCLSVAGCVLAWQSQAAC